MARPDRTPGRNPALARRLSHGSGEGGRGARQRGVRHDRAGLWAACVHGHIAPAPHVVTLARERRDDHGRRVAERVALGFTVRPWHSGQALHHRQWQEAPDGSDACHTYLFSDSGFYEAPDSRGSKEHAYSSRSCESDGGVMPLFHVLPGEATDDLRDGRGGNVKAFSEHKTRDAPRPSGPLPAAGTRRPPMPSG